MIEAKSGPSSEVNLQRALENGNKVQTYSPQRIHSESGWPSKKTF